MNVLRGCFGRAQRWVVLALVALVPFGAGAVTEETFPVLKIGTSTYTNVTVTTKAKTYVFLMHASGMATIKVADLPTDLRQLLGYNAEKEKPATSGVTTWAKDTVNHLKVPALGELEKSVSQAKVSETVSDLRHGKTDPNTLYTVLAIVVAFYLFFCLCARLICQKTGNEPGILIWIPVLQLLPLIRAADMPGVWFLAYFIPGLNIIAQIVWSVKIAQARNKSGIVAFLLILPVTYPLAFMYLAFSSGAHREAESRRGMGVMTLETA